MKSKAFEDFNNLNRNRKYRNLEIHCDLIFNNQLKFDFLIEELHTIKQMKKSLI